MSAEQSDELLLRLARCAALNLRASPEDRLLAFQVQLVSRRLRHPHPGFMSLEKAADQGADALLSVLLARTHESQTLRSIAPLYALITPRQRSAIVRRYCDDVYDQDGPQRIVFYLISVLGGRCTDALAGTTGRGFTYKDVDRLSPERRKVLRFAATVVEILAGTHTPAEVRRWFNARVPALLMSSPAKILAEKSTAGIEPVWEVVLTNLRA